MQVLCRNEFVLLGIERERKTGAYRALLAKAEERDLIYAGGALIGLRREEREELQRRLETLAADRPSIPWLRNREARWVKPKLSLRSGISPLGEGCCVTRPHED